ncbi:MAG: hypothetical protein KIS67_16190 [Verrucomicrobiae bacterium]|nr:hypothetical protein [Verrucomicrobiae bacterium]
MCAKWKDKYDPNLLAERIEAGCDRSSPGRIGFKMEHHDCVTLLWSSLVLSDEILESEISSIFWKGIFAAAKAGRITAKSLCSEISKAEKAFLDLPLVQFTVATNISLAPAASLMRRPRTGSRISIGGTSDGKFSREPIIQHARTLLSSDLPANYPATRVMLRARTPAEAASKALDDLDLIRGLWNLGLNRRIISSSSSGKRQPINQILLGPVHTIHKPDGSLATQQFFYETTFSGGVTVPNPPSFERALSFEKWAIKNLCKSKYRDVLEKAIRRYGRALDGTDFNAAFLKLWSLLELLTQTGKKDPYDVTIRRCSFIYQDRLFTKLLLEHLRDYRNHHVHSGSESSLIVTLLYQLKRHVEDVLLFHFQSYKWFNSLDEVVRFLDLPPEKDKLGGKLKSLKLAMTFHGYK